MKRFLFRVFIFCAVCSAIMLLVNYFFEYNQKYVDYRTQFKNIVSEHPKYLILGDSHAGTLKKKHLGAIVNFARGSDSYADAYIKLSSCVKSGAKPDLIFLQCDLHDFNAYRLHINNAYRNVFFTDAQTFAYIYNKPVFKFYLHRYVYPYLSLLEPGDGIFLFHVLDEKISTLLNRNSHSAGYSAIEWKDLSDVERKNASDRRALFQFKEGFSVLMKQNFLDLIKLCKENQIEIIGIRFPLDPTYSACIKKYSHRETSDAFEESMIPILDFRDSLQGHDFFFNQDHLNEKGSEWMAEKLRAMIPKESNK